MNPSFRGDRAPRKPGEGVGRSFGLNLGRARGPRSGGPRLEGQEEREDRLHMRAPTPPQPHSETPGDHVLGGLAVVARSPAVAASRVRVLGSETILVSVNHEAVEGRGEDAEPLLDEGRAGSLALAVFDGMGGAGGARYRIAGEERKGAFIASRLAREVTSVEIRLELALRISDISAAAEVGELFARRLGDRLEAEFHKVAARLGGEPTRLRSSLVRVLPTTAAIAFVWPRSGAADEIGRSTHVGCAVWAGDSRIYTLTLADGLKQMSSDDARVKTDALRSLTSDPPIDNCVSASQAFKLNIFPWELQGPCLVIAASDGCFGYLPTPAHFEYEILDTLCNAANASDWQRKLHDRLAAVARDDATLAIAVLGAEGFCGARRAFQARYSQVVGEFVQPYDKQHEPVAAAERQLAVAKERRDALIEARSECARTLWERYRTGYERYLSEQVHHEEPSD